MRKQYRHRGPQQTSSHSNYGENFSRETEYFRNFAHGKPLGALSLFEESYFKIGYCPSHLASSFELRNIANVHINQEKIDSINKFLEDFKEFDESSYDDLENTQFKFEYLDKLNNDLDSRMTFASEPLTQNAEIDAELFAIHQQKYSDHRYCDMLSLRKRLPSYQKQNQILKLIEQNPVVLISGATGCGKTTQIPQFILDSYVNSHRGSLCKILCTQPRRISAIGVAKRVADERAESIGSSIGYQVRFDKNLPHKVGSITYCTTGIVLRQMESNPALNGISHIILDEIHERDVMSDFMMAILKRLLEKRNDLKVILMSATLNAEIFSKYFDYCPHIVIEGLTYPVEEYFLEDVVEKLNYRFMPSGKKLTNIVSTPSYSSMTFQQIVVPYVNSISYKYSSRTRDELLKPSSEDLNLDLIYQLILNICYKEPPGAILVFLSGFDEIDKLYNRLAEVLSEDEYYIYYLHSLLPLEEQSAVFDETPPGVRKIVLSTNIAETSVTIKDIVYVIDPAWAKIKRFQPRTKTEDLEMQFVSQSNCDQRRGRAGRLQSGKCYHLITKGRYESLKKYQTPEILRTRLEGVILHIKMLQLGRAHEFFMMLLDCPKEEILMPSLKLLLRLGALDDSEKLTPLGYHIARLPMGPQLAKLLLFSVLFKCLNPILDVVVALDYKSPFLPVFKPDPTYQKLINDFSENCESDHLMLHKVMAVYKKISSDRRSQFCQKYRLNQETILHLKKMKKDIMTSLLDMNFVTSDSPHDLKYNVNSRNINLLKAVLCSGLLPNLAVACPGKPRTVFYTLRQHKAEVHPKSILARNAFYKNPLIAYYLQQKTQYFRIMDATVVSPFPILFFGDRFRVSKTMENNVLHMDTLKFGCDRSVSPVIENLRYRLDNYIRYKFCHPSPVDLMAVENPKEDEFVKIIIELLSSPCLS